jgi:hypothetical protein
MTILCLVPVAAVAALPGQDPDWPCQQRLVPEETAGNYWSGPLPTLPPDKPAPPRIAKLVAEVSPRDVPLDEARKIIGAFLKTLGPQEREAVAAEAFVRLVDATNQQRTDVIGSIEDLTRRQRDLAATVGKVNKELDAIPAEAQGDDAARRAEILQRKDFLTRSFEQTRATMRYACEVPGELDQRLGAFAKLMQPAGR